MSNNFTNNGGYKYVNVENQQYSGGFSSDEIPSGPHTLSLVGGGDYDNLPPLAIGGKKRNKSLTASLMAFIKRRKRIAKQRRDIVIRGVSSLLKTRKRLFKERRDKLRDKLQNTFSKQQLGRDERIAQSNRIHLKNNLGASLAQSRSMQLAHRMQGGRKRTKKNRRTMKGGAGYAIGGVLSPSMSALANGNVAGVYQCNGAPYNHYK